MNVLHLDSSIQGELSASKTLTREVVDALRTGDDPVRVVYHDLASDMDRHLVGRPSTQPDLNDRWLDEFLASDVLVIGAPMYNFAIPTQLKSWLDRVLVAGKTFRYGSNGVEGLVTGKKAIIVSTAGGNHAGGPASAAHEDYLRFVLGFIGISDVAIVRAQGLATGMRDAAFAGARAQIHDLVAA
ncbi:MAG: FMN-dependent NADH-azoreductase [Capsulimonadaceae bacterium]